MASSSSKGLSSCLMKWLVQKVMVYLLVTVAVITLWFWLYFPVTLVSKLAGPTRFVPISLNLLSWKMLVLLMLGKLYLMLASFGFVSMGNGVDLKDGLDGLARGIAALGYIGMSIAVFPICSDLEIFGASMAGACVGFLMHNRYKELVFMGDTRSLTLGGGLAAMACCTVSSNASPNVQRSLRVKSPPFRSSKASKRCTK